MSKKIKLNIGCGPIGHLRRDGYIGIDKQDYGQKHVINALDIEGLYRAGTVDEIAMDMFLEHLTYEEAVKMLNICWKLLKPSGIVRIEVPSVERGKAYEFTHRSFYTKDTFGEIRNEEMCRECGLKPFNVVGLFMNGKKNIYCTLKKAKEYEIKIRKDI